MVVVIAILGSGAVALAHLDGNGTDEAVSTMVHRVQNLGFGYDGRIELQLIGGYRDQPGGYAEDLFYNIMRKSIYFTHAVLSPFVHFEKKREKRPI